MKSLRPSHAPVTLHPRLEAVHVLPARLALHLSEGIHFLSRNDILYCTAESNYTCIYATGGRRFIVSKTLREVEFRLPSHIFFRIHKSHLVNLEAVTCVNPHHVVIPDHKPLPVAREKRPMLLKRIQQITISL